MCGSQTASQHDTGNMARASAPHRAAGPRERSQIRDSLASPAPHLAAGSALRRERCVFLLLTMCHRTCAAAPERRGRCSCAERAAHLFEVVVLAQIVPRGQAAALAAIVVVVVHHVRLLLLLAAVLGPRGGLRGALGGQRLEGRLGVEVHFSVRHGWRCGACLEPRAPGRGSATHTLAGGSRQARAGQCARAVVAGRLVCKCMYVALLALPVTFLFETILAWRCPCADRLPGRGSSPLRWCTMHCCILYTINQNYLGSATHLGS